MRPSVASLISRGHLPAGCKAALLPAVIMPPPTAPMPPSIRGLPAEDAAKRGGLACLAEVRDAMRAALLLHAARPAPMSASALSRPVLRPILCPRFSPGPSGLLALWALAL